MQIIYNQEQQHFIVLWEIASQLQKQQISQNNIRHRSPDCMIVSQATIHRENNQSMNKLPPISSSNINKLFNLPYNKPKPKSSKIKGLQFSLQLINRDSRPRILSNDENSKIKRKAYNKNNSYNHNGYISSHKKVQTSRNRIQTANTELQSITKFDQNSGCQIIYDWKNQKQLEQITLQNFHRDVKKNKQFIHKQIKKRNLERAESKQNLIYKPKSNSIPNASINISLHAGLNKNNKVNSSANYQAISKNSQASNYQSITKITPTPTNRNHTKSSERDRQMLKNKNLQKNGQIQKSGSSQKQKNKAKRTKRIATQDSAIFNDIKSIIKEKINSKSSKIYNDSFELEQRERNKLNTNNVRHLIKMNKIDKKIKILSPEHSPTQIRKKTQQNKQSPRVALKNQHNYHQWRRVQIVSGQETPVYKPSTYELQTERLQQFVLKNQISLSKYFQYRKQLYLCQSTKAKTSIQ